MVRVTSQLRPCRLAALIASVLAALLFLLAIGAVPAAATPTAGQIDAFLAEHGSPMTGMGASFVAEGTLRGVDPAFLVAVAGAESSFGLYLYTEGGDVCSYNAFNWFYGATWPQSDFTSWSEAIARVSEGLAGSYYYGSGLYSVQAIAPRYCPDGTDEWIDNVTTFTTALGGNPADTRVSAASAPPTAQPGVVALRGSVQLGAGKRIAGRRITARFTIVNSGAEPLTLDGIALAVRGPADGRHELGSSEPLTLQPGEAHAVQASWTLESAGRWYGWIEVQYGGLASLVGEQTAFECQVVLPRHAQLRQAEICPSVFDLDR